MFGKSVRSHNSYRAKCLSLSHAARCSASLHSLTIGCNQRGPKNQKRLSSSKFQVSVISISHRAALSCCKLRPQRPELHLVHAYGCETTRWHSRVKGGERFTSREFTRVHPIANRKPPDRRLRSDADGGSSPAAARQNFSHASAVGDGTMGLRTKSAHVKTAVATIYIRTCAVLSKVS